MRSRKTCRRCRSQSDEMEVYTENNQNPYIECTVHRISMALAGATKYEKCHRKTNNVCVEGVCTRPRSSDQVMTQRNKKKLAKQIKCIRWVQSHHSLYLTNELKTLKCELERERLIWRRRQAGSKRFKVKISILLMRLLLLNGLEITTNNIRGGIKMIAVVVDALTPSELCAPVHVKKEKWYNDAATTEIKCKILRQFWSLFCCIFLSCLHALSLSLSLTLPLVLCSLSSMRKTVNFNRSLSTRKSNKKQDKLWLHILLLAALLLPKMALPHKHLAKWRDNGPHCSLSAGRPTFSSQLVVIKIDFD